MQRQLWCRMVLRFFKCMQRQLWCRPNEHIHAILIGVLGRESLLDKAREVFDEMRTRSMPRTTLSYTALIDAYGRNGDHATALDLLAQMKAERIPPTVALLGLFAEMRHDGVRPDLVTYNNTLQAAAGARGLADQAEINNISLQKASSSNEVFPVVKILEHVRMINRGFGMRQISLMGELKEEMFCIRFGSVKSGKKHTNCRTK